jgi:hypothetical protein
MEGGFITLIVLVILAPFQMWNEREKSFASLDPAERNLQRASHGFAVMVLTAMSIYGAKEVFAFFPALTHPREAAWGLVFFVPFIYGLVRFVVGWRGYCGMPINDEPMLALRAFWKMAAGFVGVKCLRWDVDRVMNQNGFWWGLGLLVILTVAWWYLLTGGERFVLLTVGGSNALRKLLGHLKEKNRRRKPGQPTR